MNSSTDFSTFMVAIDENMPIEKGQLIYIYHTLGKMLFKDKWTDLGVHCLYDVNEGIYSPQLVGMISICKSNFMDKRSEIINYIFQQSIKKLEKL